MLEKAHDLVAAQRRFVMEDVPPVIGHRGAALHAPENTLAGMMAARAQGARWVEVDVKLSGEGTPFLLHDEVLDRTTSGKGLAKGTPIKELERLDAGAWYSKEFTGEKLPRLVSLFEYLNEHNMAVNLELKPNCGEDAETALVTIRTIEEFWPLAKAKPLLSSFSRPSLAAARDAAPHIARGLLLEELSDEIPELLNELACASVHMDACACTFEWLQTMENLGIPVLCYTVNDPKHAIELLNWGAHSIITDTPGAIIDALLNSQ